MGALFEGFELIGSRPSARVPRLFQASLVAIDSSLIRAVDIVLSSALLIVLAPLLLVIMIAVRVEDPGPIFYSHQRVGRFGREFPCLKFRSMVVGADTRLDEILAQDSRLRMEWFIDRKLRSDPRVTRVGAFLRRSSLDELPQIINVLRGEMSLVGPRPIVPSEVPKYGRYIANYCSVRPGMTGLWQISGRNDVCYRRRVALDVLYTRTRSLRLYLLIMMRTPFCVLVSRGSY